MAITDNVLTGAGLQYMWNYKFLPMLGAKADTSSLATVATTGNYSDLLGTPTIDSQVTVLSTNAVQSGAVYNFVNSSIATNTAYFIGTFTSESDLQAYSGAVSNNDYAFVVTNYVLLTEEPDDWSTKYGDYYTKSVVAPQWKANKYYEKNGSTYTLTTSEPDNWASNYTAYYTVFNETQYAPVIGVDTYEENSTSTFALNTFYSYQENTYNRYKYSTDNGWQYEYTLNNSSFTAAQWATIQSGFTAYDKTNIYNYISSLNETAIMNISFGHNQAGTQIGLYYTKGEIQHEWYGADLSPEQGSYYLITSGAVYTALSGKADVSNSLSGYGIEDAKIVNGVITLGSNTITPLTSSNVTSSYSSTGTSPVNGKAVKSALDTLDVASAGGAGMYIQAISETNGKISATAQTMDTAPTVDSAVAITSGGVYTAIDTVKTNVNSNLADVIDSGAKNGANPYAALGYSGQGSSYPITNGGVKFTLNANGTITTSETSNATTTLKIPVKLISGETYVISGCPSGGTASSYRIDIRLAGTTTVKASDYGNGDTFTAEQENYDLCIRYYNGQAAAETFSPMICLKSAWDITKKFVQYSPTNAELYAMIHAIQ